MSQSDPQQQGYTPSRHNGGDDDARDPRDLHDSVVHGAAVALMSIDRCVIDDAHLVGAPTAAPADTDFTTRGDAPMPDVVPVRNEAQVAEISTVKRKRGRPPRIQGKAGQPPPPPPPPQRKKKDEEDVCFICFDGGSLVLCDRRGCPKAYHPACIKRDEAFFRSKAKWNCGWHICSSCQKASHYLCYTCTYSLCKGCTKDADYVCVRGNKGFCGTCMKTILLIENVAVGNKEMVQVDFDDNTSWEYLFKVYWVYLKEKLSLTVGELTKAKNPWKGEGLPKAKDCWRGAVVLPPKKESSGGPHLGNIEKVSCSDNCCENLEANQSKRRKIHDQTKFLNQGNSLVTEQSCTYNITPLPEGTMWATKELLEFVSHMRNGNISVLSQFEVQGLLLEYIKRNNLRDPQQKCQIICDSRLINLFGKERVGHFEMLKLLEYHFLIKETSPVQDSVRMGVDGAAEAGGNNDSELMIANEKRQKTRKKIDGIGAPQINPNPDEYAAIDAHNIDLIFLKRSLMENLMDDTEKFNEKVAGSFVRIRISGGDQKQDVYRLVQVVGISKVAESYEVGTRTTDKMLEILNLDKKEVISIDGISNQEFLEDECKRLRQSIKCGLIRPLTVGEIQNKAMALKAVKVADWLEAEVLRLSHLRDRASEKGHRKELRECVEKLELLKSPKECQRRLLEIPNIHIDPHMNPSYESEEDAGESYKKQGVARPINSSVGRKGVEITPALSDGDVLTDIGNKAQKNLTTNCMASRNTNTTFYVDRDGTTRVHEGVTESTVSQDGESVRQNIGNTPKNCVGPTSSGTVEEHSEAFARAESFSGVASAVLPSAISTRKEPSLNDIEMERLWHYQDPSGKTQGPFSLTQLRKWSMLGLFPVDLRVWRINERQNDSILLTEALDRQFHKHMPGISLPDSSYLQCHEVTVTSNNMDKKLELGLDQRSDESKAEKQNTNHSQKVQNDVAVSCNGNGELGRSNGWGSHPSNWGMAVDVATNNGAGHATSSSRGKHLSEGSKSLSDQLQMSSSLPCPSVSGKISEAPFLQVRESHGDEKLGSRLSNTTDNSVMTTDSKNTISKIDEKRADIEDHSNQSCGQNWRPPSVKCSSGWDYKSGFVSLSKSIETSDPKQEIDFSDLLSPIPRPNRIDFKGQDAENKQPASSTAAPLDSGPTCSTASSLVVGGAQLPEVVLGWGCYSSTPAKSTVEEWHSSLVPATALKPTEVPGDHTATPTSESVQLRHSSPSHPMIDAPSWPEPSEFCSLVDESVSDLLAEVEAMESLGGLPSPTSKMRCDELAHSSDNDCFSPVEGFCPTSDLGKSDALSSTGDIQMSSQLTLVDESLRLCLMPSQPTVTDEPLTASQIPSQLTLTNDQLVSHTPQSALTDEPIGLLQTEILNSRKSISSGHSSSSAELEGDAKPSDASVNQAEPGSEVRPHTPSTVSQWETGSDVRCSAPSNPDPGFGAVKGHANVSSRSGVTQENMNTFWGSNRGTVQQHGSASSATSTGYPGGWFPEPRYSSDRFPGPRDHRNTYFQSRDSGFGRDRSSWNKQPSYGGGNGGNSYRLAPKGQRVCKFYESGYCKKGASCSYWHP